MGGGHQEQKRREGKEKDMGSGVGKGYEADQPNDYAPPGYPGDSLVQLRRSLAQLKGPEREQFAAIFREEYGGGRESDNRDF